MKHLGQIRIRQLRLLVWLSEGQTLSRVAQRLNITAAATSAMLQELEASTGRQLFERDRRGARPTPAGRQLALRAAVMLREFDLLELELAQTENATVLRLGVIPQVMIERVPQLAKSYSAHYPTGLQVREGTSRTLLHEVQQGLLAGAIVRTAASAQVQSDYAGLRMDAQGTEQAVIALPRKHPLATKKRLSTQDLRSLRWVLPEQSSYIRNMLQHHFQLHQLGTLEVALEVDTTVQALWCASQMGLAAAGPLALINRFGSDWQLKALPFVLGDPIQLGFFYRPSQLELPQFQVLHRVITT
jgi:DNA-binding transcriptional LysR family regulator